MARRTLEEVRDASVDSRVVPNVSETLGEVWDGLGRSGLVRGTHREVRDGSGDNRKGSERFEDSWGGSGLDGEIRDGSGDPRGGPGLVGDTCKGPGRVGGL